VKHAHVVMVRKNLLSKRKLLNTPRLPVLRDDHMATQRVEVLIEGGKATAAPPLGPALGPLGVNIGKIVSEINQKTASLKGMQVPVIVEVDTETKEYTIIIGTPPTSALLKKAAGVQKGSGNPKAEHVGNVSFDQIVEIAKTKGESLLGATLKAKVKEILGTARSMGITIDGKPAADVTRQVDEGAYDDKLKE